MGFASCFGAVCCAVVCASVHGGDGANLEKIGRVQDKVATAGDTTRSAPHVHGEWCVHRAAGDLDDLLARARGNMRAGVSLNEIEPNDAPGSGQWLSLGTGGGEDPWIDVSGEVSVLGDHDEYRFNLRAGDIFGVAVNWQEPVPVDPNDYFDSIVSLHDGDGGLLHLNDDGWGVYSMPFTTPLPLIRHDTLESMVQFVAPEFGEYRVRVRSWGEATTGPYVATFGVFRHDLEGVTPAEKQILFVDFDGETIDARAIFGTGNNPAVLSPMRSFLTRWGLPSAFESVVIDSILDVLDTRFKEVASKNAGFDYELLNSRDHADPFGQPNVSRLIVGGTIAESGIGTIGIAQWIDPGNFSREDTAIILLDLLSDGSSSLGIQNIPRAPGFSLVDAIGRVVGNVTAHEAGHYLGGWHTENSNQIASIMDQGGGNSFAISISGLGADGIMGSPDDNATEFSVDIFEEEGIGEGIELTGQRVATALTSFALRGDANGDGMVDVNDISYVLFRLGGIGEPGATEGDMNRDGMVDVMDVSIVLFGVSGG